MSIHINHKKITDVSFGSQVIQQIYFGKDLVFCRDVTIKINAVPTDAEIVWMVDEQEIIADCITIKRGQNVSYKVSKDGYWWEKGTVTANRSQTININLIKSDFPREWGKFKLAVCSYCYDEGKNDWVYTWSFHFENGTLPLVVRKNAATAELNLDYFEYIICSSFNSAVYKNGKWNNAIARDDDNMMRWYDANNQALGAMIKTTAVMWGWPNASVYTDDFSFAVSNNQLTAQKYGVNFAEYNVVV